MELGWLNELIGFMERVFLPSTISKGFQRGFVVAGFVLAWVAIDMLIRCPAGSWLYYKRRTSQRVAQAARLADEVALLEGESKGLQRSLDMHLAELKIRSDAAVTPNAAATVTAVGVTPPLVAVPNPLELKPAVGVPTDIGSPPPQPRI